MKNRALKLNAKLSTPWKELIKKLSAYNKIA